MNEQLKYYVERQASGYVGNCLLWWRKNGMGYSCNLDEAEVFLCDDKQLIDIRKSGKYRVWPKKHVDAAACPHVDHQKLNNDFAIHGGTDA